MIISIIFVILSLMVGVGTWMYIKHEDNNSIIQSTNSNKINSKQELPTKTLDMSNTKLDINNIANNEITLENFRKKSVLLKVKNSDFNMLSSDGQNVVEDVLRQLSLSLNYDIGFYSTTRTVNTSKTLKDVKAIINTSENLNIERYAINYMNTLQSIMTTERIAVREDYIILTYVGDMSLSSSELTRRADVFISTLNNINTKCEIVTTDEILDLIYHDLNRNTFFNPSDAIKLGALNLYAGHPREEKKGKGKKKGVNKDV